MPESPWLQHADGTLEVRILAEAAMGTAALTAAPPATDVTTATLSVDYLRAPALGDEAYIAHAIDWQRGRLATRQSVGRVYSQVVIHEPKTARARRSIGVDPDTLAALKAHRERQRFERKLWGDGYADHDLVFCRWDRRCVRSRLRAVADFPRSTGGPPGPRPL